MHRNNYTDAAAAVVAGAAVYIYVRPFCVSEIHAHACGSLGVHVLFISHTYNVTQATHLVILLLKYDIFIHVK